MCGRFTLRTNPRQFADLFGVKEIPQFGPRYNLAPTQQILAITFKEGERQAALLKWGLIPSWAKDAKIGNTMINARSEGIDTKPAFRSAFKRGRCLIVADGFYEWRKTDAKTKQPYYIRLRSGEAFAFAGLSEHWSKGEQPIDSGTIITTGPNELMATLHDRMPVILHREDYDFWLDPEFQGKEKLLGLLRPYPADEMVAYSVSTLVNSPKNERPECVEPLGIDGGAT